MKDMALRFVIVGLVLVGLCPCYAARIVRDSGNFLKEHVGNHNPIPFKRQEPTTTPPPTDPAWLPFNVKIDSRQSLNNPIPFKKSRWLGSKMRGVAPMKRQEPTTEPNIGIPFKREMDNKHSLLNPMVPFNKWSSKRHREPIPFKGQLPAKRAFTTHAPIFPFQRALK